MPKSKIFALSYLSLIFILFISLSLYHVKDFIVADEQYWKYDRIPQYWKALATHKWEKTAVNDKPGISLAIIGGIGRIFEKNDKGEIDGENHTVDAGRTETTQNRNLYYRLPLILFSALMLFYFYWIILRLSGSKAISLFSVTLLGLSPTIVGISQIINPDALIWSTSFALLLTFLAYLKDFKKKYLILSTFFFALALLSKYTASIFFPFFFLLILLRIFLFTEKEKSVRNIILSSTLGYVSMTIGSLILYALLLPASFLNPSLLFGGTIFYEGLRGPMVAITVMLLLLLFDAFFLQAKISAWIRNKVKFAYISFSFIVYLILFITFALVLANWAVGNDFLRLNAIPFDVKYFKFSKLDTSLFGKHILEYRTFIFSLQPFVILLLMYIWAQGLRNKLRFPQFTFSLSLFILIYYMAMVYKDLLATVRYSIILYPIALMLASLAAYELMQTLKKFKKSSYYIGGSLFVLSLISLFSTAPFYFTYTNDLLPKNYIITDHWGYGGYEAAMYLNSLPDAESISIWSDYYGVCEFFVGKCYIRHTHNMKVIPIQYAVLTRRGKIRYEEKDHRSATIPMGDYYQKESVTWKMHIDDRPQNYIKIVPIEQ